MQVYSDSGFGFAAGCRLGVCMWKTKKDIFSERSGVLLLPVVFGYTYLFTHLESALHLEKFG